MDGENGKGYVWFENCHVFSKDMRLLAAWDGRIVPLPVAILHSDCRLAASGDVGRLGVPRRWAGHRELIPRAATQRRSAAVCSARDAHASAVNQMRAPPRRF